MLLSEKNKFRIAILDLYEGVANQGMRCIRTIVKNWGVANEYQVTLNEFDVRQKCEVPGIDYDIYISTGGPGSPIDSEGSKWEEAMFKWLHEVEDWNIGPDNFPKKHVFFICLSTAHSSLLSLFLSRYSQQLHVMISYSVFCILYTRFVFLLL